MIEDEAPDINIDRVIDKHNKKQMTSKAPTFRSDMDIGDGEGIEYKKIDTPNREDSYLSAYRSFVNEIDDYFEYRNESLKDRKKVHQLLGNLTDKLRELL